MSLCLLAEGLVRTLHVAAFTLVWTHSVEKVDWQEDWLVSPAGLQIVAARVKGSGAGMEPPPEAQLRDGWWQWRPQRPLLTEVRLGNSGAAGEWRLCSDGACRTLSELVGRQLGTETVLLRACTSPPG